MRSHVRRNRLQQKLAEKQQWPAWPPVHSQSGGQQDQKRPTPDPGNLLTRNVRKKEAMGQEPVVRLQVGRYHIALTERRTSVPSTKSRSTAAEKRQRGKGEHARRSRTRTQAKEGNRVWCTGVEGNVGIDTIVRGQRIGKLCTCVPCVIRCGGGRTCILPYAHGTMRLQGCHHRHAHSVLYRHCQRCSYLRK